ncbi:MAG TPA: hypothetical protein VFM35_09730 [Candidatus Binatia bacterium]|nr:hypothetical protein [Candidatus Binatia bacterium]
MTILQTLNIWLHLIGIVLWLGAILFFLIAFAPAVHSLPAATSIQTLNHGRIYLEIFSWVGIALLLITGTVNLFLRSQAPGLSQFYVIVLSVKLLLFSAMLAHHALQVFKYAPKIAALTPQNPAELTYWPEPLRSHWKKWFMLLKINAALGSIVLLLGLALLES